MPNMFSTTSAARFVNIDVVTAALKEQAEALAARDADVQSIVLFGSMVRGDASPRSDADLMILLRSGEGRWLDRVPTYGRAFEGLGLDVDVFPVTREERQLGLESGTGFAQEILRTHELLWGEEL